VRRPDLSNCLRIIEAIALLANRQAIGDGMQTAALLCLPTHLTDNTALPFNLFFPHHRLTPCRLERKPYRIDIPQSLIEESSPQFFPTSLIRRIAIIIFHRSDYLFVHNSTILWPCFVLFYKHLYREWYHKNVGNYYRIMQLQISCITMFSLYVVSFMPFVLWWHFHFAMI